MTREELEQRLGKSDIGQMKWWVSLLSVARLRIMLRRQKIILTAWRKELQVANPNLTDLELTNLVFEKIEQHQQIAIAEGFTDLAWDSQEPIVPAFKSVQHPHK